MKYLIEKDIRSRKTFFRWEWKRVVLKALLKSPHLSRSDWHKDWFLIFPNSSHPTRIRNRCVLSGRAGSIYRRFRLSRICLREEGNKGSLPGVQRADW